MVHHLGLIGPSGAAARCVRASACVPRRCESSSGAARGRSRGGRAARGGDAGARGAQVLFCVEVSDLLFAVDSIPAVFGVTQDPLIVFTSNIFAIAGLRSLYQVISKLVQNLEYLEPAVGLVLGFVGLKTIGEFLGMDVPAELSLGVVIALLSGGVGLSMFKREDEEDGTDGEAKNEA